MGVSLDGQRAGHDRARPGPRGGSHDRVARGLAALTGPEFRHLFGGLLCVIDLDQDPLAAVVFGAAAMGVAVMRKNV